jgi:Fe-Mn family superoxide dismutase
MFKARDFRSILGTAGFSDALLLSHFALYEGYAAHAGELYGLLNAAEQGTPAFNELKRRFGWEFNGMRLHEYYFEGMTKGGSLPNPKSKLAAQLKSDFGSFESWEKDFRGTGAMRGIGWAMLAFDRRERKLFNVWINEHDSGHLTGCQPLVTLDAFEHAYLNDYGLKRPDYIAAFMEALDWANVELAFEGGTP